MVRRWFDECVAATILDYDGTLQAARGAADAYARKSKADNTRRAYRAGVRASCAWCDTHGLPCLPARSQDVVAFVAAERGRKMSLSTVDLRRASIRHLHLIAGRSIRTADAHVAETVAGMRRVAADEGELPDKKLAATASTLREIIERIGDDLARLRAKALLIAGFAGALRRAEPAAIRVKHLDVRDRRLRLTLPLSKGVRSVRAVTVPLSYGSTAPCPVRALQRWQQAAEVTEGPVFRRVWMLPTIRRGDGPLPFPVIGTGPIDSSSVARIIKRRAAAAGYNPEVIGGHSLKRGAVPTGMDRGVHPTKLKRLGRHKSYNVIDEYFDAGDPFEGHPLTGGL